MPDRLEDQIRRQTEAMYDEAPPVGSLLPADMAAGLGFSDAETDRETISLQPTPVQRRLSGRMILVGMAALAFLVFTPVIFWLSDAGEDAAGPAGVQIIGQGTLGPITSGETISFDLTVVSTGADSSDTFGATGQVHISTVDPPAGEEGSWTIRGTVVCVAFLEDHVRETDGDLLDAWEVRYVMDESDFPSHGETGLPGAYASLFVSDTPTGVWLGELTGTDDFTEPACGVLGANIPTFPLQTGSVDLQRPGT